MNIEQAKAIPMSKILQIINCKPFRESKFDGTYLSPIREETTPSFHVNYIKNLWYDHGLGIGGNVVDFVCAYLKYHEENDTVCDALRWLKNMTGNVPVIANVEAHEFTEQDKKLTIKSVRPLKLAGLVLYLKNRGISPTSVNHLLEEIRVYNKATGKYFTALGLKNVHSGYELRNPFFKGCVGRKTITFIRGRVPKAEGVHLFEGMMDYFTFLTIQHPHHHDEDVIILNSLSCLKHAVPYIKNYGYRVAYTWMDNDKAGVKATQALADFFKTEENLTHKPMNSIYRPRKDLNAWHMHNLNLNL